MPVAKLRTSNNVDALKPIADNSGKTYVRQAAGNDSLLSFSRTGDNPVQWVQLLNALDQPDLPGWPFLNPVKIQMQKCDKCSQEFCSPINYRRHIRVHRRSLTVNKEWHKNRDLLGAFWDKLSLDTAKNIVSFDDVTLEEVPGSSVIWSLTSFVHKPGNSAFPQQYVKAGSALLDIIQSRPARLPISSQELFAILDDASEGTFLSAGTAESILKFVFDGEAGKIGMEPKNLVACTSFLVEQKLVREWVADLDAESLRCQKLLVEEEEASQRRQAKLLERKRQKKLRQKEHKAKELANGESGELEEAIVLTLDSAVSSETTSLSQFSDSSSNFIVAGVDHQVSLSLSVEPAFNGRDTDDGPQSGFSSEHSDSGSYPNIERPRVFGNGCTQLNVSGWRVQKKRRARIGFHSDQHSQPLKVEPMQRHAPTRDLRPTQAVNGNKIWTRKPKPDHDNGESFNIHVEQAVPNCKSKPEHDNGVSFNSQSQVAAQTCKPKSKQDNMENVNTGVEKISPTQCYQTEQNCECSNTWVTAPSQSCQTEQNCEVMIGSISITLGNNNLQKHSEPPVAQNSGQDKHPKTDDRVSRSKAKLCRPVSQHGNRGQSGGGESAEDIESESNERAVLSESCQRPCDCEVDSNKSWNDLQEGITRPEGFSTEAAKAFLSQRWKEAITEGHVALILTPEPKLLNCEVAENNYHQVIKRQSDSQSCTILGDVENLQENV